MGIDTAVLHGYGGVTQLRTPREDTTMPTNKLPRPPGKPSTTGRSVIRRVKSLADPNLSAAEHEQRLVDMFHISIDADLAWSEELALAQASGVSYRRLAALTGTNESTMQSRVREGRKLLGMQDLTSRAIG